MRPSWVFCCASWLDIPAGCPVVLSGQMMGTHYIQPIASVTECRRFGLIQFPSSQLPFFILALRLFHHSRSLLSAGCKFGFCRIATCGIAWAACGNARHARNYRQFLLFPSPLFSASFIFSSCLLQACFESTVGAFLSNLLLLDIWSELSTFWHKFAVVHDGERIVPASGKS